MDYPQSDETRIINYCADSCPLERGGYFLFFIFISNLGYHPFHRGLDSATTGSRIVVLTLDCKAGLSKKLSKLIDKTDLIIYIIHIEIKQ